MKPSLTPSTLSPLAWRGEMTLQNAAPARKILLAAVRAGDAALDMSELESMDTAGVAVVLEAHQLAQAMGHRLTLRGVAPRVRAVLAMAQLDGILNMVPTGDVCAP